MVKTCVGTEFCRFGTQDSTAAGIEMERRFENLFTPHKVKMATVGCPRNCAEATVKDIGLVGSEGGWQVVVGGAAGKSRAQGRSADHRRDHRAGARSRASCSSSTTASTPTISSAPTTSSSALGIEKVRKDTVYAPDARAGRRCSIGCANRRRARTTRGRKARQPVHPTQFIPLTSDREVLA